MSYFTGVLTGRERYDGRSGIGIEVEVLEWEIGGRRYGARAVNCTNWDDGWDGPRGKGTGRTDGLVQDRS